jgi:hypothetical protein
MANPHKAALLETLRLRFGELEKLKGSESLFRFTNDVARIYVRYSKRHSGGRTFFGLREVDLRQLEGFPSFLCFLLDDGSPPLFIPYADFEEIFRNSNAAKDGQFKVQLLQQGQGWELYIARQGRFNVEGYVGFGALDRSLDSRLIKEAIDLSHSQVQTLLSGIGHMKGYEVFVPDSDRGRMDWSLTKPFRLRRAVPSGFDKVSGILSEIDVVWVARGGNSIEGLFEVEHTTSVYSALLRFNDILLTDPRVSRFCVVANETRRALFSRQLFRPTFRQSGLIETTSFLEYRNVLQWHTRMAKGAEDGGAKTQGQNLHSS